MRRATFGICMVVGAMSGALRAAEPTQPLYYQDPDGKPAYAAAPRQTADGRAYKPIFRDAPAPARSKDRRILYYRNPMGLADISHSPKRDPMGMDYLPVYADEGAETEAPGTVVISPQHLQTLGVRTDLARMRPDDARTVQAAGILQFDERHLATVTTKVPGWIEHLAVAATGDLVRRGQMLAEIYAPDLVASEQEYLIAARMQPELAAASVERLRALDVPEAEIARLRRTGRADRQIAVLAPEDGVVIDKPAQEGMRVEAGEALYKTADLSDMWLIADVQEQDLGAVRPGVPATARFVAFPGRDFEGRVDFIYPSLSAETRTARVRIVLANPDGALRAAMYASVRIEAPADAAPIVSVPNSAVLDSGTRQVVLLARGNGRFEPRTVQLGVHGDEWVQILDGIAAGDRVVVGANFLIDAESNLRAALQGFTDASGPAAAP